jgi:hypothetical protein
MVSGASVYMTMVIKSRDTVSDGCCRECRATNIRKIGRNKRVRWYADRHYSVLGRIDANLLVSLSCGVISDVVESSRISEVRDECEDSAIAAPSVHRTRGLEEHSFARVCYHIEKRITPADTPLHKNKLTTTRDHRSASFKGAHTKEKIPMKAKKESDRWKPYSTSRQSPGTVQASTGLYMATDFKETQAGRKRESTSRHPPESYQYPFGLSVPAAPRESQVIGGRTRANCTAASKPTEAARAAGRCVRCECSKCSPCWLCNECGAENLDWCEFCPVCGIR